MVAGLVVGGLVTGALDEDAEVVPFASTTRDGTPLFGVAGQW
jgi:hypothetical protein